MSSGLIVNVVNGVKALLGRVDTDLSTRASQDSVDALPGMIGGAELKSEEFLSSGTFVAPKAGIYLVTGIGGGSSGSVIAARQGFGRTADGGKSGFFRSRVPVFLSEGENVLVTIGGGGGGHSVGNTNGASQSGSSGGDTSFGSHLTFEGGLAPAAIRASAFTDNSYVRQLNTVYRYSPSPQEIAESDGTLGSGGDGRLAVGGMGSVFGSGTDAAYSTSTGASVASSSAANNSGAGSGAAAICTNVTNTITGSATSGSGGSGRLIVEWFE